MSLHDEIMNIKVNGDHLKDYFELKFHYTRGHHDARIAAAELAIKADAEIEILKDENNLLKKHLEAVQSASNEYGLIGMIGSPAWIAQIKKLTEQKQ